MEEKNEINPNQKEEKNKSKEKTPSAIKEDFKLKIEINKWEQKTNKITKKLEVIFNIELYSELTFKKWNVYHTIQDFKDLINNLSQIFPNLLDIIPKIKSPEKEKCTSSIIMQTSSDILNFINLISYRSDIINSKYYIDFFKLENHIEDLMKNYPKEIFHITGLKYEVSDMILLEKKEVLIVGCGQMNNKVLSKMTFWNKKEKKGQLNIYKINHNQEKEIGDFLFSQTDTESEITCLCVTKDSKCILVGYLNGNIEIFEIPEYDENVHDIIKIIPKNKIEISANKNKIINIGYNSLEDILYCACFKDIMIYSAKISEKNVESIIPGSEEYLFGFYYEENFKNINDIIFGIDIYGKIYIGTINKLKKCVEFIYVLDQKIDHLTLFKTDLEYNHIYIGDRNGNLDIFSFELFENDIIKLKKILNTSLNKDSKGKISNMILRNYPYKINDICYNPKKNEIFIALENSTVQVFSHFKNFPEFVLYESSLTNQKENKAINKLYFSKLNSILYIGRSEKDIYIYQMPDHYNSELCRRLQYCNNYEILDGNKICKNAINQGYPNNTQTFKKKSIINLMGVKND